MWPEEGIKKAFETMVFKHEFECPLSVAMIGVNGAFLTARFKMSMVDGFQSIVLDGKASKLRFPINCLIVDQKGKAAHIAFSMIGEEKEVSEVIICFAGKKYS
jgi:hypothetical protein